MIGPPEEADIDRLAKQWLTAEAMVREHCGGATLDKSPRDLDLIQELLDRRILSPAQTYELQCLGVVLGRVLAENVPELDWAIVDDEYGRDPTIRYLNTSLTLNVLTMISKRFEDGERVDVRRIYQGLLERVAELGPTAD